MRNLLSVFILAVCLQSFGAVKFVRSSASGAANGSDWNNAWSLSGINWASVNSGDTIYVAGGSYGVISFGKSGSSGNVITMSRATASISACTSAAGWSAAFDATINSTGIDIGALDYLTVDGVIPSGIKVLNNGRAVSITPGSIGVTLKYIEVYATAAAGSASQGIYMVGSSFTTLDHLIVHGVVNGIQGLNFSDCIIQYCEFYDINAHGTTGHPNVNYLLGTLRSTWRYNRIHNNDALGIAWEDGAGDDLNYLYGNVFYDDTGAHCGIESDSNIPALGRFYIYNNCFINEPATTINFRVTPAGGEIQNNIFWNSPQLLAQWATMTRNYNFASGGAPAGANSIGGGSNPFVNMAAKDFRIVTTIGATYPRNKGVNLGSPFNNDPIGVVRGADGTWDIGAYEFDTGGGGGPVISISPSSLNYGWMKVGSSSSKTITVQNIGTTTLTGTAGVGIPWSVVNGSYSLAAGASQVVTINYTPTTPPGEPSASVLFTGGGGASATVSAVTYTNQTGTSWLARDGTLISPMTVEANYIKATGDASAGVPTDGYALFGFNVATPGYYYFRANARGTNGGTDSFYVNVDGPPTVVDHTWDILPATTGFEDRYIGWRGIGTFDAPTFPTNKWYLTAGDHVLSVYRREPNAGLSNLVLLQFVTNAPVQPPFILTPPSNLRLTNALGSGTMSVVAGGATPLTYQWKHEGTNLPGQTSTSLVVGSDSASAGNYYVAVTNAGGWVLSPTVSMTLISAPSVVLNPVKTNVFVGNQFSLTGYVGNATSVFWRKDFVYRTEGTNKLHLTAGLSDSGMWIMTGYNEVGETSTVPVRVFVFQSSNAVTPVATVGTLNIQ